MTLEFMVPTMACASCGQAIAQAIQAIDPIAIVQADAQTKQVTVQTQTDAAAIAQAIQAAGYPVTHSQG